MLSTLSSAKYFSPSFGGRTDPYTVSPVFNPNSFICEGVTIEDQVFIGHNVAFVNDSYPRATTPDGELQTGDDWVVEKILVKKGASIGSGATILSNVTIGERAIVGAGSVVTRDVPPDVIVVGNPARVLRSIDATTGSSK